MNRRTLKALRVLRLMAGAISLASLPATPAPSSPDGLTQTPQLESGFQLLYEIKFPEARAQFVAWEKAHPEDPRGPALEAASHLYEEFYWQGVLTSEFFLDDKRLLGGIRGQPDETRRKAFFSAVQRAQDLARERLKSNTQDEDALFALTITTGMLADYASLIERRQLESLRRVRESEHYAERLLKVTPDSADAYLALGAANYIISCLPAYKRFFLFFSGIRGAKRSGMQQMRMAAERGHYLRPFAKLLLALAALREKQVPLARTELSELAAEFPQNPLFARELAKLSQSPAAVPASP
jgi:hypothetical protein